MKKFLNLEEIANSEKNKMNYLRCGTQKINVF